VDEAVESIAVTFENYNQAETARNFNNWARLGAVNNITSSGNEYNYIIRNYGASQAMIDEDINPIKPDLVE
jgi:hypothetical protein